ncbi:MAG: hypothetical protein KDA37_04100, partial [Planctomycetales bacterium]|nr:hypothetical protein [Planctomycetales bacterium]
MFFVLLCHCVACSLALAAEDADLVAEGMSVVRPLTLNEKTDGYRGIWNGIRNENSSSLKYSGGLGTFPSKLRNFAVYSPEANKTFFCYGGCTADNPRHLLHMVSYFDHATGEVPRPTLLLDKQVSDARENPVICLDAEGYVWVFSPGRVTVRPSYVHRSTRPWDIDAFQIVVPRETD